MKTLIQVMLIIWFISVSFFVLVPSFAVLRGAGVPGAAELPQMPAPPEPPPPPPELQPPAARSGERTQPAAARAKEVPGKTQPEAEAKTPADVYTQQVNAYAQRVTAYTQQVNAYKSQIESGKTRQIAVYRSVVTDTLVSLLSTALTALLSYVFVKAGAELVNKYVATKRGEAAKSIEMF